MKSYTKQPGLFTFHVGSKQIYSVFGTPDVDCYHAYFLPFWTMMGDYRGIIIDIPDKILYGQQNLIARLQARRLQCGRNAVKTEYNSKH